MPRISLFAFNSAYVFLLTMHRFLNLKHKKTINLFILTHILNPFPPTDLANVQQARKMKMFSSKMFS